MASHSSRLLADPARRGNMTFGVVVAALIVLGFVLIWINAAQQDRLATVRQTQLSGQKTAVGQRTDQQQLTCALWAILRETKSAQLTDAMRTSADRICAVIPTPLPSGQ